MMLAQSHTLTTHFQSLEIIIQYRCEAERQRRQALFIYFIFTVKKQVAKQLWIEI